jgi:hypothetical protein
MNRVEIIARATVKMVAEPVEYGIENYRAKGALRYAVVYRNGGAAWKRSSSWDSRSAAYAHLLTWAKGAERV